MNNIAFQGITCFNVRLELSRNELSNSLKKLVLESNATPGYYSKQNFPPNKQATQDRHLYLVVKKSVNCFQDIVLRHASHINKKYNQKLHIAPGQLDLFNESHQCIRVNTSDTDNIENLIADLGKLGIEFLPDKKVEPYKSHIFFKKYVEFLEIQPQVYQDNENPYRFFFKIPKCIEFDEFERSVEKIKNNCKFHLFDAFLNHFFMKDSVQDLVGIYSKHCDPERFQEFKKEINALFSHK